METLDYIRTKEGGLDRSCTRPLCINIALFSPQMHDYKTESYPLSNRLYDWVLSNGHSAN